MQQAGAVQSIGSIGRNRLRVPSIGRGRFLAPINRADGPVRYVFAKGHLRQALQSER
jgi:hypothetical protein